jgi:uncharacterized membrane protein
MIADCQSPSGGGVQGRANGSPLQPHIRWPVVIAVVVVFLYFLVAHGCHGSDVDHELLLIPSSHHAEQIESTK